MKPGDRLGTATVTAVTKHGLPPAPVRERKPRPNHPTLPTWGGFSSGWWAVEFRVGCKVISEANQRAHWAKEYKRKRAQRDAVLLAFLQLPITFVATMAQSFTVTLTHHGPKMDGHDNLSRAFKAVVDALAEHLGVDDGDERVTWQYQQSIEGEPGVVVRIEGGGKP